MSNYSYINQYLKNPVCDLDKLFTSSGQSCLSSVNLTAAGHCSGPLHIMTAALFSTILNYSILNSCSWQIGNSGHKYSSCEEGGGQFVTRSKQLSMRTKSQLTWNGRHSCVVRPQKQFNPQNNENKMIVWVWVKKSTFAILQMVFPTSTSGRSSQSCV